MCKFIILILSITFSNTVLDAFIINIPAEQPSIQAGVDVAVNGDTVLVQPGTYFENINYNGKKITVASLFLTTQDSIYIDQTIIDGSQNGSVVTFTNAEDSTAILTGFSVINGDGTYCDPVGFGDYYWGGGILCIDSSPTLNNLIIYGNSTDLGAGITLINSNSIINKLMICNNYSTFGGSGIACGLGSNPAMTNLQIIYNIAVDGPAGISIFYNSNPTISNSIISGNINQSNAACGGGISCVSTNATFISLKVINNTASSGGGISIGEESDVILINAQISNNHSSNKGPGIFIANSNTDIINSTITNNTGISSNIYCIDNANLTLINTILWSNLAWEIRFYSGCSPNTVNIANSDIKNGLDGINTNNNGTINWLDGNINIDPMFNNPDVFDFHLQDLSQCIGAGINEITINGTNYSAPELDLDGNPRPNPIGSISDIGAYENQHGEPQVGVIDNELLLVGKSGLINHPNPFNPCTEISFNVTQSSDVATIEIYNLKGQKVKTLPVILSDSDNRNCIEGSGTPNSHSVTWNGTDNNNKSVSSGVYFYQLKMDGKAIAQKKCLLLK